MIFGVMNVGVLSLGVMTLSQKNNTNNVNKTCALVQTTGGKDEPNIVFNAEILASNN